MSSSQRILPFCFLLVTLKLASQTPVVKTSQGYIKGIRENGIDVFKGIPYAQPPVGSWRFHSPVPHQPWTDTLPAVQFSAAALQPAGGMATGSEDCLYLNLYTPKIDDHKRAVVIWVHGGSMTGGSGKGMDGHAFADQDDIVTITINYRLGALGFLYLGDLGSEYRQSGNLGLLDVIAALQWVHDNIAAFGGDPHRVTVMGESAGAKLLSAVMVAPASKGLYQQAILESGAVQCIRDSVTAGKERSLLLKQLGLDPKDVRKLLTIAADTLIKAQAKVCAGIGGNSFFGPVYDGITIPEDGYQYARQGKLSDIKAIIGTNEQEGAGFIGKNEIGSDPNASIFQPLFRSNAPMANAYYQTRLQTESPYAAVVRTLTQYMYQLHSYRFAKALSSAGTPVYMYRYSYQDSREFGARHGDELHYIWGAARILTSNDDAIKKQLARSLHGAWVAFIKTGDPNGTGIPQWPAYKDTDRQVMVFTDVDTVTHLQEVYDDKRFPSAVFVIKSQQIHLNQVMFPPDAPKIAVIEGDKDDQAFDLVDAAGHNVYHGRLGRAETVPDWASGHHFYQADFSAFRQPGTYRLTLDAELISSAPFTIGNADWARPLISSIIHYYNQQRANTPTELAADKRLLLYGSDNRVDLHGGWCDASGDVSKYFSHLAYANFMSPQQIPLVTWSLVNTGEVLRDQLSKWGLTDSLAGEALWGADYITRSLSPEGYFYMTVFTYFKKDPKARRVVGLRANSVTTNEYQCAFREGGGMAIAALARISRWRRHGDYTSRQYLDAARRAYAHLVLNNTKYDDDGKENIIDDYCALMAATELWIATDSGYYRDQARLRAQKLNARMTTADYFISDAGRRPFWHAADAGLPVVALIRYLDKEQEAGYRDAATNTIRKALAYNLRVTNEVDNPFGYARQTFLYKDSVKDGFFIPHENETGWWWQGENARLGSLATAALLGRRLLDEPTSRHLTAFAARQYSWILGCNPYSICFMYGWGQKNVPYMSSNYGHGSQRGGISNGITGGKDNGDGSGIDFRTEDNGNEWRWTEQWLPHAAWFLAALTAMAAPGK